MRKNGNVVFFIGAALSLAAFGCKESGKAIKEEATEQSRAAEKAADKAAKEAEEAAKAAKRELERAGESGKKAMDRAGDEASRAADKVDKNLAEKVRGKDEAPPPPAKEEEHPRSAPTRSRALEGKRGRRVRQPQAESGAMSPHR